MGLKFFKNLKSTWTEFLLTIAPVMVCITILVIISSKYREHTNNMTALEKKLDILIDYQQDILAKPLWNVDEKRIQKFLDGLQNDPDFAGAAVFDENLSSFGSNGVLKGFSYEAAGQFFELADKEAHKHTFFNHIFRHLWHSQDRNSMNQGFWMKKGDIIFRTDTESLKIGTIFLILTERNISQLFLQKLRQDFLNLVIITAILLMTTMFVYSRTTSRPLKKLRNTIKTIRDGEEHTLIDWNSRNEIGQVILEFNKMQTHQFDLKNKLQTSYDNLYKSEEKYRTLLNTAPYGIQLTDLDGRITYSNPAHHRIYGYADEKLVGSHIWNFPAEKTKRKKLITLYDQMVKTQPKPKTHFSLDRTKDGQLIDTKIDWSYVRDPDGELVSVLSVISDISEQKKAEKERDKLIIELQDALDNVKTLSGLMPICAHCKNIRDDNGYWNKLEAYIEKHSEASFSHSLCPGCSDELYGDQDWYIEMKESEKRK